MVLEQSAGDSRSSQEGMLKQAGAGQGWARRMKLRSQLHQTLGWWEQPGCTSALRRPQAEEGQHRVAEGTMMTAFSHGS